MANVATSQRATATPAASTTAATAITGDGDFFLVAYPHTVLGTGAGANKPWLQELSDPVSKISWQSWAEIHPLTARRLGIAAGDHLKIDTAAGSITVPAFP